MAAILESKSRADWPIHSYQESYILPNILGRGRTKIGLGFLGLFVCLGCTHLDRPAFAQVSAQPGTLSGLVADETGPLPGLEVLVYRASAENGHPTLVQACASYTDSDGAYRCDRLAAGNYMVSLEPGRFTGRDKTRNLPAFWFYPGTGDISSATVVQIVSNDFQSANFTVSRWEGYKVAGKTRRHSLKSDVDMAERTDSGLEYRLPVTPQYVRSDEFVFAGIPSGRYLLSATSSKDSRAPDSAAEINVGLHDLDGVVMSAVNTTELAVSLKAEEETDGRQVPIQLENIRTGRKIKPTFTGAEGILFSEVKPDDYALTIEEIGDSCLVSISTGRGEIPNRLHIDGQQPIEHVEATIRSHCGSISGTISPAVKADVLLFSETLDTIKTATSDARGRFTFNGLPSGSYYLYSCPSLKEVAYRSPIFLRSLAKGSLSIVVNAEGSPVEASVPLAQ